MRPLPILLLTACTVDSHTPTHDSVQVERPTANPSTGDSGGADSGGGDSGSGDSGDPGPTIPPCADGTWGGIDDPDNAVHVSAEWGAVDGDGTQEAPLASVQVAIDGLTAGGVVAIWPGAYAENLSVTTDGLGLQGCSAGEVALTALDTSLPGLVADGADTLTLDALTFSGGTPGVQLHNTTVASLSLIAIANGNLAGLVADGADTVVVLDRVQITDPVPAATKAGTQLAPALFVYEAQVQGGSLSVSGATAIGVLVHGGTASLVLTDSAISTVSPNEAGELGRGLHVQAGATVELVDTTVSEVSDAGVYILQAPTAVLTRVTVSQVAAALVVDSTDTTGDGLVVSGDDGSGSCNPSDYTVVLTDVTITDFARFGILLDSVAATASGTTADPGDGSVDIRTMGDTSVGGSDEGEAKQTQDSGLSRSAVDISGLVPQ
jgi:hypothetical protein